MKKVLVFLLLVLVSGSSVFAQQKSNEDFLNTQILINQDLDDNFNKIKTLSDKLSTSERLFIYNDYEKTKTLPFILNFVVGLGIGSWVQGHTTGGLIGTIGHLTGYGLLLSKNKDIQTIGGIVFLGTWITDLILPFTYANSYNKTLKNALKISSISSIKVVPTINVTTNNIVYPGAAISVQF